MATPRRIITVYLTTTALYTLATSMIWGINTLFLMDAGLDIFQVMLVNASFTVGMVLFEVPTGVVADTLGRRISFLYCIAIIFLSTLVYLAAAEFGWGIWPFAGASVLLGLGFTFYTGAVEAWLVDALEHTGYSGKRERVFAAGQIVFSSAMLVGTVGGGLLGQLDLSLPYVVRASVLIPAFLVVAVFMEDHGFQSRPIKASSFGSEARRIFLDGVQYGWHNGVIRFCILASFVEGLFFIFGWYSWQRYFLDLLARELVWVAGIVSALFALSNIAGNTLVPWAVRALRGRSPAFLLAWGAGGQAFAVLAAGVLGLAVSPSGRGVPVFTAAVAFYLLFGLVMGIARPVRQDFINRHIPSAQRATVLSVDSLFLDAGGVVGQTGLGYISRVVSIPAAWVFGGVLLFMGPPLYRKAEKEEYRPGSMGQGEDHGE